MLLCDALEINLNFPFFFFAVCHDFPPISPTRLDLRVQGLSESGVRMHDVKLIPSS